MCILWFVFVWMLGSVFILSMLVFSGCSLLMLEGMIMVVGIGGVVFVVKVIDNVVVVIGIGLGV